MSDWINRGFNGQWGYKKSIQPFVPSMLTNKFPTSFGSGTWNTPSQHHTYKTRERHGIPRMPRGLVRHTIPYRKDPKPLREDLPKIFALVAEKKDRPAGHGTQVRTAAYRCGLQRRVQAA
jgi:hypothetical protein